MNRQIILKDCMRTSTQFSKMNINIFQLDTRDTKTLSIMLSTQHDFVQFMV